MLKIDKISLVDCGFTPAELVHLQGKAVVKAGGVKFEGNFRMVNCGAATMCTIDAAGKLEAAVFLNKPEDLTVELSGSFVRKVAVPAGATKLDTGLKVKDATVKFNGAALSLDSDPDEVTKTYWAGTLEAVCKDRVVDIVIEFDDKHAFGSAAAHDSNINHKIELKADNEEGNVHFAILANVSVLPGKEPNKTSLEVRGAKPWKVLGEKACVHVDPALTPSEDAEGGATSGGGNG